MTFAAPIAEQIWDKKYRFKAPDGTPIDYDVTDTWQRIADALAEAEHPEDREFWAKEFYGALEDFKFLPAGRITAGAGTGRNVTMQNCYGLGTIDDSMEGILDALKDAAITMQRGGGIGHDFSTLRPTGALVKGVGSDASGPLSFMDMWDAMCKTIMSAGERRGAMMATMRCDHPDIEAFITAKQDPTRLRKFNMSVLLTDAFMEAVKDDSEWDLSFNDKVYKTVRARDLWNKIMESTYAAAEPGVIFIDRINQMNPLNYAETISVTNPCGEQPLPPYGACLLGSVNLARLVMSPYESNMCTLDWEELRRIVHLAVRMMDNVMEVTQYPLPQQKIESQNKRRIGLGVTGLADALVMLGMRYGDADAVEWTEKVMRFIAHEAYLASARLADAKEPFPLFNRTSYLTHPYVQQFDESVRNCISDNGLRNSHLTSIAPTGTISLYAGNVSSGIEPVFAANYTRKVLQKDGSKTEELVEDYAVKVWHDLANEGLPPAYVDAQTLSPEAHVKMQAAAQKWVDSSISKTVNCPEDISFEDFKSVYQMAYDMGCKGCTTYRPNAITGSVLSVTPEPVKAEDKPYATSAEDAFRKAQDRSAAMSDMARLDAPLVLAERPAALPGETYKIKWPGSAHAIYVTINDDEEGKPFEIFINSKDTGHFAWTVALTRMISAVFRRGGDVRFVADELEQVFDPRGGAWIGGKYLNSPIAWIGSVIRQHMDKVKKQESGFVMIVPKPKQEELLWGEAGFTPVSKKQCPDCQSYNTKNESGCFQCLDCGSSKCG